MVLARQPAAASAFASSGLPSVYVRTAYGYWPVTSSVFSSSFSRVDWPVSSQRLAHGSPGTYS